MRVKKGVTAKSDKSSGSVLPELQNSRGGKAPLREIPQRIVECRPANKVMMEAIRGNEANKKRTPTSKRIFCLSCYEGLWGYQAILSSVQDTQKHSTKMGGLLSIREDNDINHFPFELAGVVIILGRMSPSIQMVLSEKKVPVVLVDNFVSKSDWSTVNSDNLDAMSRAVDILAELGHRRIAFMCRHEDYPQRTSNLHQRQAGYIVGMCNNGLDHRGLVVTNQSLTNFYTPQTHGKVEDELTTLAEKVLSMDPVPTAVIAANDLTGHILRGVAIKKGLRIPKDLSIIGYDGQHRIPGIVGFEPLSTMVVNFAEIGRAMIDMASDLMANPDRKPRHVTIPTEFENAGTSAKPRG